MNKRISLTLYIIFSFCIATVAYAEDVNLKLVLNKLAAIKHIKSDFVEMKMISMLDNNIKLSGVLEYTAPDVLIKKTLKPTPELFTVKGNSLHVKNSAGENIDLLLTNYPVVAMFVEAYRGVLSGNLEKLKEFYDISFKGNSEQWSITLIPIEDEGLEIIERIVIEGMAATVTKYTTFETSGDKSVMRVKNK